MNPRQTTFASPYPQTPTPGGGATAHQLGRPPLTSLKPFGYSNTPRPTQIKKPHPLTQVSLIDSLSLTISQSNHQAPANKINPNHDITLNRTRDGLDQSLEDDLIAFEQEQRNLQNRPVTRNSYLSDQLSSDDQNTRNDYTQTEDDDQDVDDDERDGLEDEDGHDIDSFKIGLSSLSPPGIGRSAPRDGRLSADLLEFEDTSFQVGNDFSRDLSALSLSPIRKPAAPTSKPSNLIHSNQQPTTDRQGTQTPPSGFQGMARQLRREFEQITGIPSPNRSNRTKKKKTPNKTDLVRDGTLRGSLPNNGGLRAKRVFGNDLDHPLKLPQLHQLHTAGLASTPPVKGTVAPSLQKHNLNQARTKNGLINNPPSQPNHDLVSKPTIRVQDVTNDGPPGPQTYTESIENKNPQTVDTSLAPGAHKIVGNSIRVPDVTGLTDALRSPEKATFVQKEISRGFKPFSDAARPDPTLSEALALLRRRLGFLETENEACQTRIRDLQLQLGRANQHSTYDLETRGGSSDDQLDHALRNSSKPSLERMVLKLKSYTRRLNTSIEAHAGALDELTKFKNRNKDLRQELGGVKNEVRQWSNEVEDMKHGLEGLTQEVREIRSMVEGLVKQTSQNTPLDNQPTPPSQPGMSRRGVAVSKLVELKPPLSKSQQEIKRQSQAPASRLRTQTQPSAPHIRTQSQAPAPHFRSQSQQTKSGIEEWRSQTSISQNSGQSFLGPEEIARLKKEVEKEHSIKVANSRPTSAQQKVVNRATVVPSTHSLPLATQPVAGSSKAPPARTCSAPNLKLTSASAPLSVPDELSRGEAILKSIPKAGHDNSTCTQCRLRQREANGARTQLNSVATSAIPTKKVQDKDDPEDERSGLPPQTILVNILRELEEDFEVHRKIFVELSDQYKKMNPASTEVVKRKALAQHLRESVDTLEKKAGHIKHLYDLLHFKDLPIKAGTTVPDWK
ncbi:hypothetical protein O181_054716 [Austropuccinia psidii MF-1]|uniref:Cep57 centrosome microtubule-binding domain-containing protein n=1 Tax=Austropuccinia psidii MF-1 TaxID=1389203 RepID=A0A9Q3E9Z0_9BASI|nr:hypothetical protein [Austropuccinia psidii MF-1]